MRPAALIRGASRKPRHDASSALGSVRETRISSRRPGLAGTGHLHQPVAHEPPVLAAQRHQVGNRRQRHELEVLVGGGRAERLGQLVRHRGPAQVARTG